MEDLYIQFDKEDKETKYYEVIKHIWIVWTSSIFDINGRYIWEKIDDNEIELRKNWDVNELIVNILNSKTLTNYFLKEFDYIIKPTQEQIVKEQTVTNEFNLWDKVYHEVNNLIWIITWFRYNKDLCYVTWEWYKTNEFILIN
jgi:hypothetical protein